MYKWSSASTVFSQLTAYRSSTKIPVPVDNKMMLDDPEDR